MFWSNAKGGGGTEYLGTEYYTEVHLHCFLRKLYSSWFVTQQVP
jgi:hypothetical protein